MGTRILTVEDDERIRTAVRLALEDEGWEVEEADTGEDALQAFTRQPSDVVLIDIMLPGIDGFELCRRIRAKSSVPIVMVTARSDTHDVVAGLEAGADDYLTKDISLPHLTARIAALFRRQDVIDQPPSPESLLHRGKMVLDIGRLTVTWDGHPIGLTVTEFWMVHALAKFPGHVKSRQVLMQESKIFVDGSTITSHVKRIRKKFLLISDDFDCIETVYGMGYRWNITDEAA